MEQILQLGALGVLSWTVHQVFLLSRVVAGQQVQITNLQKQLDSDSDLHAVLMALKIKLGA